MKPLNIPPVAAQRMVAQAQGEIRDNRVERIEAKTLQAGPRSSGDLGCAAALIAFTLWGYLLAVIILILK